MTPEQETVLTAVKAGASIDEAAQQAGRPVASVRRWLTEGRKAPDGPNGEFAALVDDAREAQSFSVEGPMTLEEVERALAKAIRSGSVPAVRTWLQLHPPEVESVDDDPFAEFA